MRKHNQLVKLLSLMLVLMMLLGLAACGSGNTDTPAPTEAPPADAPAGPDAPGDEPAASTIEPASTPEEAMARDYISYPLDGDNTITMWYYAPGYIEYVDSNFDYFAIPYAEEATGVHIDFTEVNEHTVVEQFNLMMANGDYCDIIPAYEYYTGGLSKALEEEVIMAIDEYIDENMPNYAAVLTAIDDELASGTKVGGKTLAFYRIDDGTFSSNGLVTRGDWLDEIGFEFSGEMIPLSEYTDMLYQLHDKFGCENTYYLTADAQMAGVDSAFDTDIPTLQANFMMSMDATVYRIDDKCVSGWVSDGYRDYIEWLKKLMDDGVIYSDFLSLDDDRGVTNVACGTGKVAVWQANADKFNEIGDYADEANAGFKAAAVPRIVPDGADKYVWNDETSLLNAGMSISHDCEQPELVCQWMNYFWTKDGYMLSNYGVEGETYEVDSDGNALFLWQKPVTITGKHAPNAEMAQALFTMMRFTTFYADADRLMSTFEPNALEAVKLWTIDGSTDDRNYPIKLKNAFTAEESEEIAKYESDLITYAQESILAFLLDRTELNDDTWNAYVAKCNEMGLDKIVDVYQSVYDGYLAGEVRESTGGGGGMGPGGPPPGGGGPGGPGGPEGEGGPEGGAPEGGDPAGAPPADGNTGATPADGGAPAGDPNGAPPADGGAGAPPAGGPGGPPPA